MRDMRESVHEEHDLSTADLARSGHAGPPDRERTRDIANGPQGRGTAELGRADNTAEATPLFNRDETEKFRSEWAEIQAGFVDQPAPSVEHADALVASVMKRLAEMFADERGRLEGQWHGGGDISTEDLRLALQRYRSFFTRLLSV
jgi:hypothetical protein